MDLSVSGPDEVKEELAPPNDDDKRLVDNIKNLAPTLMEKVEPITTILPETKDEGGLDVSEDEDELELKPIVDEKIIFSDEVKEDPPSPPTKKKKVPSAKQREHLKKAREKALATRRANAKKRKEEQEAKRLERERKRQEKEEKMIQKEQKEYESKPKPTPKKTLSPSDVPKSMRHLSDEDIIKLQQQAIENYEIKRKERKAAKKKEQQKAEVDKKVYESITKAVGQDPNDIWGVCFQ